MTDAERRLWQSLRNRRLNGAKFRRQMAIGPFFVDFACVASRLAIEIDGGQHAERVAQDERRTAYITAQGYRVLRFWNNEVLRNTEGVLAAIADCLNNTG
jgi:very-short-patch-repair endonuclease